MTKRILSFSFLIIIFLVLISCVFGYFIEAKLDKSQEAGEISVAWDAKEAYPLYENEPEATRDDYTLNKGSVFFNKITGVFNSLRSGIKARVTNSYPFRMPFIKLQKIWDKSILGYNLTTSLNGTEMEAEYGENVVALQNGQLSYFLPDRDLSFNTERFISFGKEMQSEGRDFLLFITPSKSNSSEIAPEYFGVYKDYTSEKEGQLIELLTTSSIDYVICDGIQRKINEGDDVFFNTDHHWLPQTALLGCKELTEYMNAHYGYSIDTSIYSLDNYNISDSPYLFLGSQGKKVTEIYVEPENISIITPNYDSDYTVFISGINRTLTGSIFDTLINMKAIKNDLYTNNQYNAYGYGDQEYIHIHNNKLNDGKRVLIIKQSFADTMIPFLGNIAEDIDIIDYRLFSGSVRRFIDQNNPDDIVFIYGATAFCQNDSVVYAPIRYEKLRKYCSIISGK